MWPFTFTGKKGLDRVRFLSGRDAPRWFYHLKLYLYHFNFLLLRYLLQISIFTKLDPLKIQEKEVW